MNGAASAGWNTSSPLRNSPPSPSSTPAPPALQRDGQSDAGGRAEQDPHPQRPHRQADEQPGGNSNGDADNIQGHRVGLFSALPRGGLFLGGAAVVLGVALVAERLPAAVLQHLQPLPRLIILLR